MALQDFRELVNLDLSRNNRFIASGTAIPPEPLNTLLQTTQLPGIGFSTADWRDFGPLRKFPYDILYNEIPLTFLDTADHQIKAFYDDWMQNEVYRQTGFGYMDDYRREFEILKLDRQTNVKEIVRFYNVWPSMIEPTQLDSSATNTLTIISVTLTFEKWERI